MIVRSQDKLEQEELNGAIYGAVRAVGEIEEVKATLKKMEAENHSSAPNAKENQKRAKLELITRRAREKALNKYYGVANLGRGIKARRQSSNLDIEDAESRSSYPSPHRSRSANVVDPFPAAIRTTS